MSSHLVDLQQHLKDTGRYFGRVDNLYGTETRAAVLTAMCDGPDTKLSHGDIAAAAGRWNLPAAHLGAVIAVEASGAGFFNGKPKILFEPHRFSRSTGHRFDGSHPTVSYRNWGNRPYPGTQEERYGQLLLAVGLDPWAAFMSASYGLGQVLGENFSACGFPTPWHFAFSQARDEAAQLAAMLSFISNAGLMAPLRAGKWGAFAAGYNGSAYRQHNYDGRLKQAAADWRNG